MHAVRFTRGLRFLIYLTLFFLLGLGLHAPACPHLRSPIVKHLYAQPSSQFIKIVTPGITCSVEGDAIKSKNGIVRIGKDCDGFLGFLLLAAAVCAFPMALKKKGYGVIFGILLLYTFNLLRIVSLFYFFHFRPGLTHFIHVYVGQPLFILTGVSFFILLITRTDTIHEKC